MKQRIKQIAIAGILLLLSATQYSCNDFLDQIPQSAISPEMYLNKASELEAYVNGLYGILPSGIILTIDQHTDNQAAGSYSGKYVPGQWKVGQTGGAWTFGTIYSHNYFLERVLPKYEAGTITGLTENIRYYIGEVYFLRAYEYFVRYKELGDYPILTVTLPDDLEKLTEASKRMPRNEVARFILSDLDLAIEFMEKNPDTRNTRINKESALLLKSRVALYEGTFLKYFKGTALVPGGPGWPGASKDYNKDYTFPSGSIDAEIEYFLDQAIYSSRQLADMIALTSNTGHVQQDVNEQANPYMDMYSDVDLSKYKEVLLWREYNRTLGVTHGLGECTQQSNHGVGVTRGMTECFLMANGLPIYASGSGYHGDDYIADVKADRDNRLYLFLKEPGQKNVLYGPTAGGDIRAVEPVPNINGALGTGGIYNTGYTLRKGNSFDGDQSYIGAGVGTYTGTIAFRGVEAMLNYIEAYYERTGTINITAKQYWEAIRNRAKVNPDYNKTIAATEMEKEAPNDWGAYSAGRLLTDATLYNIRRERRCELMGEGLRAMDLQRWRSMDQMITTPYHIEGFKVWGPMKEWYKNDDGSYNLNYGLDTSGSIISPPDRSEYLRPYEKNRNSLVLDGYRWNMAHYLSPIAIQHFVLTSKDGDLSTSPIYQNPGWPLTANEGPVN
ncbi:MAG: RagB/SusD family nutrient uptake outer membrane protein [Proteiniphilum sp.]|jgi:hypothetical protein|nr:RagB/SusD family nutrient uptake outer membrane protein [Proteiniphilum sp.]